MSQRHTYHSPEAGPESKNLFCSTKQVLVQLIIPILVTKLGHWFLQDDYNFQILLVHFIMYCSFIVYIALTHPFLIT